MNTKIIDSTIRQLMRKSNTPGVAISVIKDENIIYSKGFGCRNLKQQLPMTSDTLIGIGSITKSMTAFAIIKLQEMGKLSIEDSVSDYLEVEPFKSRCDIKLKHLLSHSSGIPSLDAGMLSFNYTFNDLSRIYPASSREDFMAHLAGAEEFIVFKPGEKFFYNNDMYTCLGFIIEGLSCMSFEQFIQQEILDPLRMKRAVLTKYALDQDLNNNVMTGYLIDAKNGKAAIKEGDIPIGGFLQAAGGLYASMNEMLNYAQCLLNNGQFNGEQLISPASVSQLFSGKISTPYGNSDNPQYALGWSIEEKSEEMPYVAIRHGGGMGTSSSFLIMVPELKLAICAAENSSTGVIQIISRAVIASVLGKEPTHAVEDLRLGKILDDIEGTYKSAYNLYSLTISLKGRLLQADVETDDGSFIFPLIPHDIDKLEFFAYSLKSKNKANVVFYRNKDTNQVEFAAYDRFLYRRT